MGRVLSGGTGEFVKTPTVKISAKPGATFLGTLKDVKDGKFGKIFIFAVEDTNAPITVKNEKGELEEVEVAPGDDVAIFASGQLKDKLVQANTGEKVSIKFVEKKLNPKSGRYFNEYHAEIVD